MEPGAGADEAPEFIPRRIRMLSAMKRVRFSQFGSAMRRTPIRQN